MQRHRAPLVSGLPELRAHALLCGQEPCRATVSAPARGTGKPERLAWKGHAASTRGCGSGERVLTSASRARAEGPRQSPVASMAVGTPSPALSQGKALVCICMYTRALVRMYGVCFAWLSATQAGEAPCRQERTDTEVSSRSPVWKVGRGASRRTSVEMGEHRGLRQIFLWVSVSFNSACLTSK